MKIFRQLITSLLAATFFVAGVDAQTAPAAPEGKSSVADEMTDAEVRKIDRDGRKITLKHGEIRNLGMPPMAMVFQVRDAGLLDRVKVGDKVRFKAVYDAGTYLVTDIQPVQ